MTYNQLTSKLSKNYLEILDDDEYYYDATIVVGRAPCAKEFRAHMVILFYRCPYMKDILLTKQRKQLDEDLVKIKLPDISPDIFQIILRYIYGGKLVLDQYNTSDIIKILLAANELNLLELTGFSQAYLIGNKASWTQQNYNLIYRTSFESDSFMKLQNYCIELMSAEPDAVLKSLDFSSIPGKLWVSIIQNGNLQMSEIQIWENVLKWGLAQNPELPTDPARFSKENFKDLKETLQQYIPFIRFYNFTSKEFLDKVLPYKKIISKEVYNELIKHHLSNQNPDIDPNDKPIKEIKLKPLDSKIITDQYAELISKWIDKLDINDRLTNTYEFELLLRGSRDGILPENFHSLCDDKPRTVTIIKVKDDDEILGGYNPIAWKSSGSYFPTKNSFIFSFKNKKYILSHVMDEKKAVRNDYDIGPSFGMGDLTLWGTSWSTGNCSSKKVSYEKKIRDAESRFFVEDYEVFQIVRR